MDSLRPVGSMAEADNLLEMLGSRNPDVIRQAAAIVRSPLAFAEHIVHGQTLDIGIGSARMETRGSEATVHIEIEEAFLKAVKQVWEVARGYPLKDITVEVTSAEPAPVEEPDVVAIPPDGFV